MKRKALVQRLKQDHFTKLSKKKISHMVNFLINNIKGAIQSGEDVKISGFGTFRRRQKRIVFKPSKKLLWKLKTGLKRSKM
ncbi:MAG: HU family DNA-binding protein [Aquificota bacterium]|nr:HU family DNA-binding protein [Aquificaceae bacterium]QWK12413.1 MAG: HU family DNA-binding protein [Aquificota bacterium]HAV40164.1 hypothetical protein [Aquificaceae bacterium]HCO38615.1 hypothetical protein [Aquificaceae bacterium]